MDRIVDISVGILTVMAMGTLTGLAFNPWALLSGVITATACGGFLRQAYRKPPYEHQPQVIYVYP